MRDYSGSRTTTVSAGSSGGISFAGLLTILFIALKLTGHITWSWIWVLSPLWIGLALVLAIFLVFGFFALLAALFGGRRNRW